MDLMFLLPDNPVTPPTPELLPTIVHNCKVLEEKDELEHFVRGTSFFSKLRRWFLATRIVSRKHPLTIWCLKSTTVINYEITRHLRSYPYMIHPFSSFRIVWESIMTIFTFVALLVTPILLAFYIEEHKDWHLPGSIIDAVFISDIVIWFFTGYYDYQTKVIVLNPRIVATKYLKGFFLVDLIPVLPLEFLADIVPTKAWCICSSLNMLKLLRMRTLITYGRRLRYVYGISFEVFNLLEMSVIIIMCIHWAACFEYYVPLVVAEFYGMNEESWIHSPYLAKKTTNIQKYFTCVNRATAALTCSAHYLDMKTPEDIILNLILTVIGSLGFIYLLARFLQLMTTFHSNTKRRLKLIQQLQEYMRHKELPGSLQRRLLIFYNYRERKGFERDKEIINEVSPYLREELILHAYRKLISSVELFKYLSRTLIADLASTLHSKIYMNGDVIVKAGTRGDALYFVASGTVAVYTAMKKEVCHLEDGAHFGEITLVVDNEYRIASVIAIETCEIYVLYRNDFQRIMLPYPNMLKHLQNVALAQLENTLNVEDADELKDSSTPSIINISAIKVKRKVQNSKSSRKR